MTKSYKIWIAIEEWDNVKDECEDYTEGPFMVEFDNPNDAAAAVIFLQSKADRYITGPQSTSEAVEFLLSKVDNYDQEL